MGVYNIRLGSQLTFDDEKEQDLITVIEQLNKSHKIGQFISHLLRLAIENPDIVEVKNGQCEKGEIMRLMDAYGISYNRDKFFKDITKEVADMKKKIDSIYELSYKTYMLALMGKQLGLEEKSNNALMADFILERQLKDIQDKLGLIIYDQVYASNKLDDTHERANEALEYIIESYSGIVNELKSSIQPVQVVQSISNNVENTVAEESNNSVKVENTSTDNKEAEDDEIIDFGDADLSLLSNFFGDD